MRAGLSPLPHSRNENRYALICQDEGLVPIVEPDISLNGDYDLETAVRVNVMVQAHLYKVYYLYFYTHIRSSTIYEQRAKMFRNLCSLWIL